MAIPSLKNAWANRATLGDQYQQRELAAFLPAALEIQETPPHPLVRWVSLSLLALLALAIAWACIGEVNIVASAEGKIIPSSRVKQIQPLEKAMVKRILVKEGESVTKGQPLIELDNTLTRADQTRLEAEHLSAQLSLAVSQSLLKALEHHAETNNTLTAPPLLPAIAQASHEDQQVHQQLLQQQWQHYRAQYQALANSLQQNQAEQAATRATVKKLAQTLPIISKRTEKMAALHKKHFATETDYLELEQSRIQVTQDLAAERERLKQLKAAHAGVQQQIYTLTAQTQAEQLSQIADTQRQLAVLDKELAKATDLDAKQILYAPVSGQVQSLNVNTVGGVVTEAQQLMLIVPDEEQLAVEVLLQNKDIGFVDEGMGAEIKIHTFPFTQYGVIDATINNLSDDATLDEQQGLVFPMQLALNQHTINVNGKAVKLIPGMAVTAEVQTGKRKIIEFFLAPLLRHQQEGLRER